MPKVLNARRFHRYNAETEKTEVSLPIGAVYVGRPSKWGNPFVIGRDGDRAEVVRRYREYLQTEPVGQSLAAEARTVLKGKDLICWCAPDACHADILLEIANV